MNKSEAKARLLKFGLFPERLTNIFSSESFGDWALANLPGHSLDCVTSCSTFYLTRNNNAPRILSIPNPMAHCRTTKIIVENWEEIENSIYWTSATALPSMLIPNENNKNQRVFSMDGYDKRKDQELVELQRQLGAKYMASVDISMFYPSIYTHSFNWAVLGINHPDARKPISSNWGCQIDRSLMNAQERQSKGIPIGPDTSSIIAEFILAKIDTELSTKYSYVRYIDDYKCFCKTKEEAENFIKDLSNHLSDYKLHLNSKKTKISDLPKALTDSWVRKLKSDIDWDEVTSKEKNSLLSFLDLASDLALEHPDESSIRYAAKVLVGKPIKDWNTYQILLGYFLNLTYLYPYVADIAVNLVDTGINTFGQRSNEIKRQAQEFVNVFLIEHSAYKRSDALVWSILLAISHDLELTDIDSLVDHYEKDACSTTLLYFYTIKNRASTKKFDELFKSLNSQSENELGAGKKADYGDMWLFIYEYSRINGFSLSIEGLEKARIDGITFLSPDINKVVK